MHAVRPKAGACCAGGSAAVPEGEVVVRLYDGAVGPTYLAQAQAQASLNAAQQLAFSADLAPAEAGRHSGHMRVSGSIPLRPSAAGKRRHAGGTNELDVEASSSETHVQASCFGQIAGRCHVCCQLLVFGTASEPYAHGSSISRNH